MLTSRGLHAAVAAMGLRLKVLVLLAAEVVGICYCQRIAQSLQASALRSALEELCADEQSHLHFHGEFLWTQVDSPMKRWLFSATWRGVTLVAQIAVYLEHRSALKDLGVARSELFATWRQTVAQVEALVVGEDALSSAAFSAHKVSAPKEKPASDVNH